VGGGRGARFGERRDSMWMGERPEVTPEKPWDDDDDDLSFISFCSCLVPVTVSGYGSICSFIHSIRIGYGHFLNMIGTKLWIYGILIT
jgi:hypothetical protein